MKLSRRHLRRLIESVVLEANNPAFRRKQAKLVRNKDKAKAEKVKSQISKADWNAGYEVEVSKQDDPTIGGAGSGGATNPYLYGVAISGFSQQKEADNFATIVKDKLSVKAVSVNDKTVMVDPRPLS